MKNKFLSLVFCALLGATACESMLEEHPLDKNASLFEVTYALGYLEYLGRPVTSVSGKVILCSLNDAGNPNARVTLSGLYETMTTYTDNDGNFVFNSARAASYTITVAKHGYQFIPDSRAVTVPPAGLSNITFETSTTWERTFGGEGWDRAYSIRQNSTDCGYIISGYSDSVESGNFEFYLSRLDVNGNVVSTGGVWPRLFGGLNSDIGFSSSQDSLGNIVALGSTESYGSGLSDLWIMKLDQQTGTVINEDVLGGTEWDEGRDLIRTSDGGFVVAGNNASKGTGLSDYWVAKYNSDLDFQWDYTWGTAESDKAFAIIEDTSDSNSLICAGYSDVPLDQGGGTEIAVVKHDAEGDLDWAQTYHSGLYSEAYGICNSSDGYVIAGYSKQSDFVYGNLWIFKVSKDGNSTPIWSRVIDYGDVSKARSISPASDGGFLIAGYVLSPESDYDMLIIKVDSSGETEWERIFNGTGNREDRAFSIHETSDGGVIVAGYTEMGVDKDDIWAIKLNQDGNILE